MTQHEQEDGGPAMHKLSSVVVEDEAQQQAMAQQQQFSFKRLLRFIGPGLVGVFAWVGWVRGGKVDTVPCTHRPMRSQVMQRKQQAAHKQHMPQMLQAGKGQWVAGTNASMQASAWFRCTLGCKASTFQTHSHRILG